MKVGTPVRIRVIRANAEQYNGCVGQISSITRSGLVYVCIGKRSILFYLDELEEIAALEGGAT